jgi:exodeoxyribonuclease VII small subunit
VPEKKRSTQNSTKNATNLASFESEFARLGAIVEKLEEGSISLEEMLKLYEEGIGLAGSLSTLLKEAELRVEKLARAHEEMLASGAEEDDEDEELENIESYLLE